MSESARQLLLGRLLAVHDLWASGYITTEVWRSRSLPLMRQLHTTRERERTIMAVEVIHDTYANVACFCDNTTGVAFGPVFEGIGAGDDANDFLDWLRVTDKRHAFPRLIGDGTDPRDYSDADLRSLIALFEREREAVDA